MADHNQNLEATLKREKEHGVTLKLVESTFCSREVHWFRWIFSAAGISVDPEKIEQIYRGEKPESVEDIWSFLQTGAYNMKFVLDQL